MYIPAGFSLLSNSGGALHICQNYTWPNNALVESLLVIARPSICLFMNEVGSHYVAVIGQELFYVD